MGSTEFILIACFAFLTGVALKVMGVIRRLYPIRGRMGLALFYLFIACYFLNIGLTLPAGLLLGASILMVLDLKLHEIRVKHTEEVIKMFEEEQKRISKKLEEESKGD